MKQRLIRDKLGNIIQPHLPHTDCLNLYEQTKMVNGKEVEKPVLDMPLYWRLVKRIHAPNAEIAAAIHAMNYYALTRCQRLGIALACVEAFLYRTDKNYAALVSMEEFYKATSENGFGWLHSFKEQ